MPFGRAHISARQTNLAVLIRLLHGRMHLDLVELPRLPLHLTYLTRRRDPHRAKTWQIYFADIHVGTIARTVGNPNPNAMVAVRLLSRQPTGRAAQRNGSDFEKALRVLSARRTEADYQA